MLPETDPTGLKYQAMPEKWQGGDFKPNEDRKIDDLRPNLWERPESNWADEYFVDFKVHHTTRSNKIEGANVHIEGWQVSDNAKGFELVTTEGSFGAKKTIKDGVRKPAIFSAGANIFFRRPGARHLAHRARRPRKSRGGRT